MDKSNSKHTVASTGYIITKWMGFISAIWVQAIAGNNYGFSNYSVALKAIGNYNQVQLNSLGVAKDVGKALGVLAGFGADYLPPWLILLIGSVDGLIGYGVQWLVLSRRISPLPYWQMCVVLCMGGNSTTWMNTAVLVTSIRNFRNSRGPVVGILKGYIGLSTAIFTVFCSSLFSNDPGVFVLLLAVVPFAVCAVAMVFLHPVPASESRAELEQDRKSMFFLNVAATVLAFYLLFYDYVKMPGQVAAVFLGLLLLVPLYLPVRMLLLHLIPRKSKPEAGESAEDAEQPLLSETGDQPSEQVARETEQVLASSSGNDLEQVEKPGKVALHAPELGEDHTVVQVLKKFEFWLLFVSLLCGMGTGTVVINNLGQIGETLGFNDVGSFVSLTSVWGFFGRIGSGLVSEHFVRSSGLPRPAWLALSQLLMIVGFLLMISAVPGSLYIGSSITGLCYGVRLAVTVSTASELFGLKRFGLIYNILIINIPLGSFLFSGLLAGILYDYEAKKTTGFGNSILAPPVPQMWDGFLFSSSGRSSNMLNAQSCGGSHCYRLTFVIMLAVCVLGFLADTILTLVTRRLYKKLMQSFASKSKKSASSS